MSRTQVFALTSFVTSDMIAGKFTVSDCVGVYQELAMSTRVLDRRIGRELQRQRKGVPFTQSETARRINMCPGLLSRIERGQNRLFASDLLKLSVLLPFNLNDFAASVYKGARRRKKENSTPLPKDFAAAVRKKEMN